MGKPIGFLVSVLFISNFGSVAVWAGETLPPDPDLSIVRLNLDRIDPGVVKETLGIQDSPFSAPQISAEVVVGEAKDPAQVEAAKSFLAREVNAMSPDLKSTLQVIRVEDPAVAGNSNSETIAGSLPAATRVVLPPPPWYANAKLRKLAFASIRVFVNGTGTAAIYLSEKGYPLEMSLAGAGLAAVMSGLLQYYSVAVVKHYLDFPFLNRALGLPSRQHPNTTASPLKQWFGRTLQGAEFWAKWYGLEVGFIGFTAGALIAMSSWIGFDMGPDFASWQTILGKALETAAYSMAGQGAWDRFIINRLNHWNERIQKNASLPHHAADRALMIAEGSFAFNSMVSVILALTSMAGADFAVTGLYAYAGTGIAALAYDWVKTPIQKFARAVKSFFGFGCERALEPESTRKNNQASAWPTRIFLSATPRLC